MERQEKSPGGGHRTGLTTPQAGRLAIVKSTLSRRVRDAIADVDDALVELGDAARRRDARQADLLARGRGPDPRLEQVRAGTRQHATQALAHARGRVSCILLASLPEDRTVAELRALHVLAIDAKKVL